MSAQIKTDVISRWHELADALLRACEWSDPATAEPCGTATYERLGNSDIVRMRIEVDLIPIKR